tara:strand:- start:263 stop:709 length:447 start_codon:yes stop_codon:yes gene_type:complete
MVKYSQDKIDSKFRKEECLECNDGKLNYTGSSDFGGWVMYHKCDKCNIKYEFQETDMGQTQPYLVSNAISSICDNLFETEKERNFSTNIYKHNIAIIKDIVEEMGFESVEEFHKLNTSADLSDPNKMQMYLEWKENDGTKEGLLKVIT